MHHKLHIGTRLSAILLAAMAVISFTATDNLNKSYWWLSHSDKVIENSENIRLKLYQCQSANRGYLITHDQSFLAGYQENVDKIFPFLDKLEILTSDNPVQQENISKLRGVIAAKLSRIRKDISLVDNNKYDEATTYIKIGEGESLMRKIQSIFDDIREEEEMLLEKRSELVKNNYTYIAYGMPTLIMLSLAILIVTSKMGY